MDQQSETKLKNLATDAAEAPGIVKQFVRSYRTAGVPGLLASLEAASGFGFHDYADFKAALPVIKSGYKTTEFWIIVGVLLLNAGYTAVTGKALPLDANATIGALAGIYTIVRGIVKAPASKPPPVVLPAPGGPVSASPPPAAAAKP